MNSGDDLHNERYNAMRAGCEMDHLDVYSLKKRLAGFSRKVCAGSLAPTAPAQHTKLASRVCAAIKEMEAVIDLYMEQQGDFLIQIAQCAPCASIGDEGL